MPQTIEDWTHDQFSALLLLHAAHADLDYTNDERVKILEYISEKELSQIEDYYRKNTDAHILQTILEHKSRFYKTPESQQKLLQQLRIIFEADGEVSKLEHTQYEFLGRFINDSAN